MKDMTRLDESKICFIACVNDQKLYEESLKYISKLIIPAGMRIDCLSVEDADSMCAGYQQAMMSSDAKYKIYMHQDVFIQDEEFLINIVEHFKSNPECGLLGVVGSEMLWMESVWWYMPKSGAIVDEGPDGVLREERLQGAEYSKSVAVADGLLLATQYDIDWREDLFENWHFYDISQCMEFRRKGYDVQLLGQQKTACIHMCGKGISQNGYQESRISFLREYEHDLWRGIFKNQGRNGPFTTIIVIKHDNEAVYKLCLECIRANTAADTYEIITVNRDSEIAGINEAIERSAGSEIMLLDDRVIVTPYWLSNLRMALYGNPKVGAVGPAANDCHVGQNEIIEFNNLSELISKAKVYNLLHPGKWHSWPFLEGCCFIIRREVYEAIGAFDAKYKSIDLAVIDYCFKLQQQEFRLAAAHDTFVFRNNIAREGSNADKALLDKRWQISEGYKELNMFLLKHISLLDSNKSVLVVGSNAFMTIFYLKLTMSGVKISYCTDSKTDYLICKQIVPVFYAKFAEEILGSNIIGQYDSCIVLNSVKAGLGNIKVLADCFNEDNIFIETDHN